MPYDYMNTSRDTLMDFAGSMGLGITPASAPQTAQQQAMLERYLAEQKRQADRDYGLKKREVDQQYQIAKLNARTTRESQEIDKWYNRKQVELAQQRLAEEGRQFDQRLGFDREVHADTMGLNRAKLGYDLLGLQANLRGPEDYFAASNLSRGVAAQPGSATFLNALRDNTNLAGFGAQAGAPDAVSVNSLMAKMGGPQLMPGTGAASTNGPSGADALHSQIQQIGAAGAHKLGPRSLEQLTPTELGLIRSGLETAGPDGKAFDWDTFLSQYRNSRIGQSFGSSGAA